MFRIIILILLASALHAQPPRLVLPIGHTAPVTSTCISPDGEKLLTVSSDGTAKLWEINSGKLLQDYKSGGDASVVFVTAASFSPDGNFVIINYEDHELSIWDTDSGKKIWDWSGTSSDWEVPARNAFNHFSPDGKQIAMLQHYYEDTISTTDRPVIYDCKTQQPLMVLKGPKVEARSLFYTPDGKNIIASCADSSIRTWDAKNGKLLKKIRFRTDDIQLLQVSKDNRMLLFTEDSATRIMDIVTGIQSYPDNRYRKKDGNKLYELSPDGTKIIILSGHFQSALDESQNGYNTATVWDTHTSKQLFKVSDLAEPARSTLFNSGGNRITLIAADSTVRIIDASTGKTVNKLGKFGRLVNSVRYNITDDKIITTLRDESILVWDAVTGKLNPALSADTNTISANIKDDGLSMYDMATGKTVFSVKELTGSYSLRVGYSGDRIWADSRDRSVSVWNASTGRLINSFNSVNPVVNDAVISDDGKFVAMACADHTASVWDVSNGNMISEMRSHSVPVQNAWFSSDMRKLFLSTANGKRMLNLENGKLSWDTVEIERLINKDSTVKHRQKNSPDGNLSLNWGADIVQLSPNTTAGEEILKHQNRGLGPQNGRMDHMVHSVNFSPDSKFLVLTVADNSTRIFDIAKDSFIDMIILIDSTDYINRINSGYYLSSTNASKQLHYVTNTAKVISFDQLDVKYNRPDKVLQVMGNFDTVLISSYRNAYFKRIQKLKIDTAAFRDDYIVPEADFANRNQVSSGRQDQKLLLHIRSSDAAYTLDRFNVWINDVPVYGMKGISITARKQKDFDTTITVLLSQGDNRIETSVTNVNGIESYRKPLQVKYSPQKEIPGKVYFIGIGINQFADASHNLTWCVQDIRDLTKTLQTKYGDRLQVVDTLYNERATWTNIRSLKKKLQQTTVDDKVIISFSGHGLLSRDYDYYLSSYTVNFSNPEEGGIPYDEIEQMLDEIPARKKIMLLDACHSGEVDKDELKKIQSSSTVLAQNKVSISNPSRGVIVTSTDTVAKVGLQNSFELMQLLFVNVSKGTGAVVISASGGVQFAQERSELGHGVFTYSVIEALRNSASIKVSAFKNYIENRVMVLTNGLQKPTTRNEPVAIDWEL